MKFRHSLIAATLAGMATIMVPSAAQATALAQSNISFSNFLITDAAGNPISDTLAPAAATSGQIAGTLSGYTSFVAPGGPAVVNLSQSTGPGYNPIQILAAPNAQYSGSTAQVTGSSILAPGASVLLDNTVSLINPAVGTAQSNASLNALFNLTLDTPTAFRFSFTANPYLIGLLGQSQLVARADYAFSIIIRDALGQIVSNFTPDGVINDAIGGADTSDPFSLTKNVNRIGLPGASITDDAPGDFVFTTISFAPGAYQLQVAALSSAAATFVPEPATLALLGVALLGLGITRRPRKS